jgi:hypothetical protein
MSLSSAPVSGILACVILTAPDADLAHLLVSAALLAQMWPGAYEEVQMLIQLLKLAVPALAQALSGGLITALTAPTGPPSAQISLAYRAAVLSGTAGNRAGEPVITPHLRAAEVWRLQITDLAVAGVSGLRLAG